MKLQDNPKLRVFEVKKNLAGKKILEINGNKQIENADNFEPGEKMFFDVDKGEIVAVRKEMGWSINSILCSEYTKNLMELIS